VGVSGLAVDNFLARSIDDFVVDVGNGGCGVDGEEVRVSGGRGFVIKGAEIHGQGCVISIFDVDKGVRGVNGERVRVGGGWGFVVKGKEVRGQGFVVTKRSRDFVIKNRSLTVGVLVGLLAGEDFDVVGREVRSKSSRDNGSFDSDDVRSNGRGFVDVHIRRDVGFVDARIVGFVDVRIRRDVGSQGVTTVRH
jgi:hypothetical protein